MGWLGGIQKLCWQEEVGRWFFECQRYLIALFSKHVNLRKEGGQNRAKNGQNSFWMPPNLFLSFKFQTKIYHRDELNRKRNLQKSEIQTWNKLFQSKFLKKPKNLTSRYVWCSIFLAFGKLLSAASLETGNMGVPSGCMGICVLGRSLAFQGIKNGNIGLRWHISKRKA